MTNSISKLSMFTAVTLIAFASGSPVVSQDAEAQERGWRKGYGQGMKDGMRRGMRQGQQGFMRRFAIIDANDDGRISDDEAAAQRESVFLAMDGNDDGELTETEYMEVRMGTGEGRNEARRAARQEQKRKRFAPMDVDKSGKISKSEWMQAGKQRFSNADSDKDGIVTPWEFRSQHHS